MRNHHVAENKLDMESTDLTQRSENQHQDSNILTIGDSSEVHPHCCH